MSKRSASSQVDETLKAPAKLPKNRDTLSKKEEDEDARITRDYDRLTAGHFAYATPTEMTTGQTAMVTARVATADVPISILTAGLGEGGQEVGHKDTKISLRMRMKLTSADFTITPISSEDQSVLLLSLRSGNGVCHSEARRQSSSSSGSNG